MNLIGSDIQYLRKTYDEALSFQGIPCRYQYPHMAASNTQGEPTVDSYSDYIDTYIFFDGTPKLKTYKRYGWVVENDKDFPFLVHCTAAWGPCYNVISGVAGVSETVQAYDGDDVQSNDGDLVRTFGEDSPSGMEDIDAGLENASWIHFPATQAGLESFISTYRGPASNYRLTGDYSYQMAMTLLAAGYDVLTYRVCPGKEAQAEIPLKAGVKLGVKAKYAGSFGDNLSLKLTKITRSAKTFWNLIVYVIDSSGVKSAVENLLFTFNINDATDTAPYIDEVESKFVDFSGIPVGDDSDWNGPDGLVKMSGGTDIYPEGYITTSDAKADAKAEGLRLASIRYTSPSVTENGFKLGTHKSITPTYLDEWAETGITDINKLKALVHMEWVYNAAFLGYQLLKDKLNYNPKRIISPGWDDMNISAIANDESVKFNSETYSLDTIAPLHEILMEVAYYSRCACAMLDIPKACPRKLVYNESTEEHLQGYAQRLSRIELEDNGDINGSLYVTHSALFAPWAQYKYVGMGRMKPASPAFLALLIQRAQILNQPLQYEWALPTNRKHSLKIGEVDFRVPKKLLDQWQSLDGVGVNIITALPDLGTNLWGNSTLFEVPIATYQALANLSTRYLVDAVEDVVYKCGLAITWQYNNEQAYNSFYAGVTPLLDTMKNVGAIEDYKVKMSADINGLDQVNANSVVGQIWLTVRGVINDITVDLIALPPGVDISNFGE